MTIQYSFIHVQNLGQGRTGHDEYPVNTGPEAGMHPRRSIVHNDRMGIIYTC